MKRTTEEMFQRAREDERFRQSHLDSIKLDGTYIHKALYDGRSPRSEERIPMETKSNKFLPHGYFLTMVYPSSYESSWIQREDDFLSILVDHEGAHSRQLHFLGNIISNETILEYGAYGYQLYAIRNGIREVSAEFLEELEKRFEYYQTMHRNICGLSNLARAGLTKFSKY
ncbi:MAG: hypothetical protein HY831_02200 [Candidatus Aenigmarchaeota archaeon]|nr:hypothetical protein [Candidatus Aenigmarchaeota archaeon]